MNAGDVFDPNTDEYIFEDTDTVYKSPVIENITPPGHEHCTRCINTLCAAPVRCEHVECRNRCGATFHECKETDHMSLCPEEVTDCPYGCGINVIRRGMFDHSFSCSSNTDRQNILASNRLRLCTNGCNNEVREYNQLNHDILCQSKVVDCINSSFGCEVKLPRYKQARHLKHCPAATLFCRRDELTSLYEMQNKMSDEPVKACVMSTCKTKHQRIKPLVGSIIYDEFNHAYALLPEISSHDDIMNPSSDTNLLETMPLCILLEILRYLDSLSLRNASVVSKYIHQACASLLQEKGIVYLEWKKSGHEEMSFTSSKVWTFSKVTSNVKKWIITDHQKHLRHLEKCDTYKAAERKELNEKFKYK